MSGAAKDGRRADVRLGTPADPGIVAALEPDAVVVATGAAPYEPALPLDGVEVVHAWSVLAGNRPAGRRVVVASRVSKTLGSMPASEISSCLSFCRATAGSSTIGEAAAARGVPSKVGRIASMSTGSPRRMA